jgi:hypothetical protein
MSFIEIIYGWEQFQEYQSLRLAVQLLAIFHLQEVISCQVPEFFSGKQKVFLASKKFFWHLAKSFSPRQKRFCFAEIFCLPEKLFARCQKSFYLAFISFYKNINF